MDIEKRHSYRLPVIPPRSEGKIRTEHNEVTGVTVLDESAGGFSFRTESFVALNVGETLILLTGDEWHEAEVMRVTHETEGVLRVGVKRIRDITAEEVTEAEKVPWFEKVRAQHNVSTGLIAGVGSGVVVVGLFLAFEFFVAVGLVNTETIASASTEITTGTADTARKVAATTHKSSKKVFEKIKRKVPMAPVAAAKALVTKPATAAAAWTSFQSGLGMNDSQLKTFLGIDDDKLKNLQQAATDVWTRRDDKNSTFGAVAGGDESLGALLDANGDAVKDILTNEQWERLRLLNAAKSQKPPGNSPSTANSGDGPDNTPRTSAGT